MARVVVTQMVMQQKLTNFCRLRQQWRLFFSASSPQQQPEVFNPETCLSSIKQCQTLKSLKTLHAFTLRSRFHHHHDLFFITNLVSQYASLCSISHAFSLFSSVSDSCDLFLWNAMIRAFVDNRQFGRSLQLYAQMRELDINPDNFTFPFVLKACGYLRDIEFGVKVHKDAVDSGYWSDVFVGDSLIAMYGKCGHEWSEQLRFRSVRESVVTERALVGECVAIF